MSEVALPDAWRGRALVLRAHELDLRAFSNEELATAGAFRLPKRRDEFLLSRYAAKQLALARGLAHDARACAVARPRLVIDGHASLFVSLSHSAPYAAAAIGNEPVGIDVQVVRPMKETAAHLFLTDDETAAMNRCTIADRALHFWCAKEAAWKQRLGTVDTLKQLPLTLIEERGDGLLFDLAETRAIGDAIIALTR